MGWGETSEPDEVAHKIAQLALSAETAAKGIAELAARMDALETSVEQLRGTIGIARLARTDEQRRVDL